MSDAKTQLFKVSVAGGDLEVASCGDASKKSGVSIILLHGWTLDRRMWAPQLEALSAEYSVIAVDRRGFGRSTALAGLHLEVEDILAVQAFFAFGKSVIVGMSQAGRIALEFAARHPDRTSGLIVQGAGLAGFQPPPKPEERIPLDLYREHVRAGDMAKLRESWRRHPLMRSPNPAAVKCLNEILEAYEGRDLDVQTPVRVGVSASALDRIEAPVLAITGDQETPWRQLTADAIAYGVMRGQRAIVENAGHTCNLCNPERYNALVREFLETLPSLN